MQIQMNAAALVSVEFFLYCTLIDMIMHNKYNKDCL